MDDASAVRLTKAFSASKFLRRSADELPGCSTNADVGPNIDGAPDARSDAELPQWVRSIQWTIRRAAGSVAVRTWRRSAANGRKWRRRWAELSAWPTFFS